MRGCAMAERVGGETEKKRFAVVIGCNSDGGTELNACVTDL